MSRRAALVGAVVVALVLVAGVLVGTRLWRDAHRTPLEQAAAYAPADAQRLSWTDWAAVRDRLHADLDADSSAADLRDFLDQGYDDDLTSASALVQSAPLLQAHFGFSPATVSWELFSQADDGAVVILKMPDDVDLDGVGDQLEESGFVRPDDADGVWRGDDALSALGADLTPELQYVALDADAGLVLTSDKADYLQGVVGDLGDTGLPDAMDEVVSASGDALSAAVYAGDYTCSALAMSHADDDDQALGARLVAEAGEVSPIAAFAMSMQPGGHVLVAMGFEDEDQARTNAKTRATLAAGPAPGQGGDFTDRFAVASSTAEGDLVRLDLTPKKGTYVLSDLSSGPVLFATC